MSVPQLPVGLPGFQSPGVGFEEPFAMLEACHQRVERMLTLLERLQAHAQAHGFDTQAQQAARDVMRYFDLAAPLHHQDEELHVFPVLLAGSDAKARAIAAQLVQQHRSMEDLWARLRTTLLRMDDPAVASTGIPCSLEVDAVQAFADLYRAHIALEEQLAYPAAQAMWSPAHMAAASEDMMRRRGVQPLKAGF